ncbi:hypothetical protein NMY22_g5255 [Coprinellus aureogranulatus]|nr:hypothetical protein NMY22_g5255 [Coprinellus aureogranulatus]
MESPFANVLHTNYAPNEQELGTISHLLSAPEQELQGLDATINHVEAHLDRLWARRNDLQAAVDAHRALTGWIRRMPDEILQEIFLSTLPCTYLPTMSSRTSPVVLTHVCRRWRQLAHSNPRLWAGLHVKKGEDEGRLSQWLARTGSVPISLTFESVYKIGTTLDNLPDSAHTRWESFQLSLGDWGGGSLFHILSMFKKDRPFFPAVLKDMENNPLQQSSKLHLDLIEDIRLPSFYGEDPQERIKTILKDFNLTRNQRLKSLTLRIHIPAGFEFELATYIPCNNLAHLDLRLGRVELSFIVEVLRQCPKLVTLRTPLITRGGAPSEDSSLHRDRPVAHRGIQQLSFSLWSISEAKAPRLLDLLRDGFPSLSFMHLHFTDPFYEGTSRLDLPSFIPALNACLTSLTISPVALSQDEMMDFLAGLPDLVQLHLLEVSERVDFDKLYDAEIVWFLSPRQPHDSEGEVRGGARLQYLKLGRNSTTVDDEALPSLLFGREVPLRQAHIHFHWEKYEMDHGIEYEDFAELIAAGLDLQLRYGSSDWEPRSTKTRKEIYPMDRLVYGWET